jgi:dGTPase
MRRGRDPDVGLAPWAALERGSRGRRHPEPPADWRGEFQRDRDRIIHSTAFRRLVYKTQVFINHEGDMYRTRLTHSIEVAQIGRSVALALSLSEPLTEAICLAHDLGHTPFGHAGQDVLNDCMREYGGFEHNLQSLRVVDELEERYAEFPGLNLTFETREGILKHCSLANARLLGDLGQRFLERRASKRRSPTSPTPSPTTTTTSTTDCAPGWSRSRSCAAWRCSRASTMRCSRVTASCPAAVSSTR